VERKLILIVYAPWEPALQAEAALANEPDGSGNTYQFRVTGPLLDEPQAASAIAVAAIPSRTPNWRTLPLSPLSFDKESVWLRGSDGRLIPDRSPL
jgi:hypothetical protein